MLNLQITIIALILTIISVKPQTLTIRNLRNDPLLLIKEKSCKIQTGTIKIIHPINLSSIEETAELLVRSSYKNDVHITNPLTNILRFKTRQLYSNLHQLKPQEPHRTKRWNAVGTVWKWIAGTPDASDLHAINTTMNELIDQNNQQFKINQNINDRIQELTHAIREITIQANLNDLLMNDIRIISSIFNIDIINKLLEDIQDAIMLSKVSIATTKILSIKEIITIKGLLDDQGINIHLPDEALQFVTPKFATSPGTLLYFMHVPLLENTTSSIIRIYPMIHKNQTIRQYPEFIVKNGDRIFTTQKPGDFVQRFMYLRELNDRCINALLNGRNPECSVVFNNQTIYKVISDNTLLISNIRNQKLESNCGPENRTLDGNLLITFSNCTIRINNQTFRNEEYTEEPQIIHNAFYNLQPNWKLHEDHDLGDIHQKTIQNRKTLEHVYLEQSELNFKFWSLFGGFSFSGIVIMFIFISFIIRYGTGRSFLKGGVVTNPNSTENTSTEIAETSSSSINQHEQQQQQEQLQHASDRLQELEQRIKVLRGIPHQQHASGL